MKNFATATVVVWSVVLLIGSVAVAQRGPSSIDNYVDSEMKKQHIPGLALLIARDGEVIRLQGYGFSNVEHHVPVKPETIFQSGSVGKQFTATAVVILGEAGKM